MASRPRSTARPWPGSSAAPWSTRERSRRPWAGSRRRASTQVLTLRSGISARRVRHRGLLRLDLREDGVSRIHQPAGGLPYQRILGALGPQHPARPLVGFAGAADRGPGLYRQVWSAGGAQAERLVVGGLEDLPGRGRLVDHRLLWPGVEGPPQPRGGTFDAIPD